VAAATGNDFSLALANFSASNFFPVLPTVIFVKYTASSSSGGVFDTDPGVLTTTLDVEPPVWNACPHDIHVTAERGMSQAIVAWDAPFATDNVQVIVGPVW
jgi:hypothetical protein